VPTIPPSIAPFIAPCTGSIAPTPEAARSVFRSGYDILGDMFDTPHRRCHKPPPDPVTDAGKLAKNLWSGIENPVLNARVPLGTPLIGPALLRPWTQRTASIEDMP
jgi:hypothetical protein